MMLRCVARNTVSDVPESSRTGPPAGKPPLRRGSPRTCAEAAHGDGAQEAALAVAVAAGDASAGEAMKSAPVETTWEPVDVPKPAYVEAAKAERPAPEPLDLPEAPKAVGKPSLKQGTPAVPPVPWPSPSPRPRAPSATSTTSCSAAAPDLNWQCERKICSLGTPATPFLQDRRCFGAIAQLVERFVRIEEVRSSNLLSSTDFDSHSLIAADAAVTPVRACGIVAFLILIAAEETPPQASSSWRTSADAP